MQKNTWQTVGQPLAHESAALHVKGMALYTDDLPERHGMLHAAFGLAERAHARVLSMDLSAVRQAEGVVDVISLDDVPGTNTWGRFWLMNPYLWIK